jgi:hypothetical protein
MSSSLDSGLKGQVDNSTIRTLIAAFTAVALYNVVELNVLIFTTFRRYRGLYFWSMLAATWGVFLNSFGFLMKFFGVENLYFNLALISVGAYGMVTGQSLVLYSRVHLVLHNDRILHYILVMIIVNAVCWHTSTTILIFGSNSSMADAFATPYSIIERIQLVCFGTQECIISFVYLYAVVHLLKPIRNPFSPHGRKVMLRLAYINDMLIIMDVIIIVIEYLNLYEIQVVVKAAIYSVKLKLEFAVLNQLIGIIRQPRGISNVAVEDSCNTPDGQPVATPVASPVAPRGKLLQILRIG